MDIMSQRQSDVSGNNDSTWLFKIIDNWLKNSSCLCNMQRFFKGCKKIILAEKTLFFLFCAKHRLWVHIMRRF